MAAFVGAVLAVVMPGPPAHADTVRDQQWALRFLRVADAHRYSTGKGIIVAVIDTGVDADHPDLAGNVLAGRDAEHHYAGGGNVDHDGHGTAMAGLIAGHGHGPGRSYGILGIAPGATILPIHVFVDSFPLRPFRTDRPTDDRDYVEALNWAVDYGARVISMSTQAPISGGVYDALTAAHRADVVLVAAAGNRSYSLGTTLPATHPDVIAVGGIDPTGRHWTGAVTAPEIRLAAPAVNSISTSLGGGYQTANGTSDAAAIVSGAVALIRAQNPKLTAEQVTARLLGTATDAGPPGRDDQYGYGIVNPYAALTTLQDFAASPAPGGTATTDGTAAASGTGGGGGSWWGLLCLLGMIAMAVGGGLIAHWRRQRALGAAGKSTDRSAGPSAVGGQLTREPGGQLTPEPGGQLTREPGGVGRPDDRGVGPPNAPTNTRYQPRHANRDATPHRRPRQRRAPDLPVTRRPDDTP